MRDDHKDDHNLPAPIDDDGFAPIAPSEGQIIVGTLLRFVDGAWTEMGLPVPAGLKLLALTVNVVLQRWQDQRVIETITEKPLPDVADLNAEIPEREWETDLNGNPRPPWTKTYVVYLLNEQTCEKYTFANSTIGARLAYETLTDRVAWMRKLRGVNVVPEVELVSKPMRTRFGVKQRPDFKIIGWKQLGGGGGGEGVTPRIAGPAAAPGISDAKPVTTKEEFSDEIPF
jgi:hypothetical protein